jgi:hypothetical protein
LEPIHDDHPGPQVGFFYSVRREAGQRPNASIDFAITPLRIGALS